jgi:hypothetical protein
MRPRVSYRASVNSTRAATPAPSATVGQDHDAEPEATSLAENRREPSRQTAVSNPEIFGKNAMALFYPPAFSAKLCAFNRTP